MKLTTALALCLSAASQATALSQWLDSVIAHEGEPVGQEVDHDGLTLYVSKASCKSKKTAVIYLTDVFGIELPQNKLLADSFARAGFFTVAPDLFDGSPAPADLNDPSFNVTEFLAAHDTPVTDPKIASAIEWTRDECGDDCAIALTGYCYGGRYAFRFVAEGKGGDVAFAAHPSLLQDDEILAITGPAAVAAAEHDDLLPAERRHEIEDLIVGTGQPYQMSLYSGTQHGFGVRADVSDAQQRFGKETAFLQAVQWFEYWA